MRRKPISFDPTGLCYLAGWFLPCNADCKYHPENPTESHAKCNEEQIG